MKIFLFSFQGALFASKYIIRGDIVIGNDLFGKYKNELQIVLEEHQYNQKNKVGQIIDDEHLLLDYIKPWSKFLFQ